MRFVFIVYNIAINDEVMETVRKLGLKGYTRWEEVTGVGKLSGPHLNTHIWPAKNSALGVVAEDEKAGLLMEEIRQLRKPMAKEGIKAFSWKVEDST